MNQRAVFVAMMALAWAGCAEEATSPQDVGTADAAADTIADAGGDLNLDWTFTTH